MKKYRYYTKYREPGPGAVPGHGLLEAAGFGGRRWDEANKCHVWGYADYSRELTTKEVNDFELAGPEVIGEEKKRFYFTFGSDAAFPFPGGWVEVLAGDMDEARDTFRSHFPSRDGRPFLNCAFVYTEEQFKATVMYETGTSMGHGCWAEIDGEEVRVI